MNAQEHAEIVIIGGGIVGCSIAYHLSRSGKQNVVVLEKARLTEGATWHAAGLIGQLRGTRNATRMIQRSVEVYDSLGEESGLHVDWKKVGSLRIASSIERMKELKQLVTTARSFGVDIDLISAQEAQEMFPPMTTKGVLGAAYIPGDGYADPSSITQAFARVARRNGVKFRENTRVTGVRSRGRRIQEVVTDTGTFTCEVLVNAAGMWSRDLGLLSGANIPVCAVEHQYVITETIPGLPRSAPTMRDPDRLVYYKPELDGLAIGGYEPDTVAFGLEGIPTDFARELLPNNLDRFFQLAEKAAEITPVVNDVGLRHVINGPIPESADGDFVMGRVPGFDNYYVASGFLYGIAAAGGAGEVMKEWIIDGTPSMDLWSLDVRRFHPVQNTKFVLFQRALEHYARHYRLRYPGTESDVARNVRLSPLHHVLTRQGAVFGTKAGWERPNWFAPKGEEGVDRPSFDRAQCNWFPYVEREARAVRNSVALIDQSSFAKMEVWGARALEALQYLSTCDLDKPVGSVMYTQMCNATGGIEADLTITRLSQDTFYIITGSGFGVHDFDWIRAHLPIDGTVETREMTNACAVINICGPKARKVLAAVTDNDVSNAVFRFGQARHIDIGATSVLALRVSYTGELGWELHVPVEHAQHVYEQLWQAGTPYGIVNAGYRAIDSLRMEKGFVYWSADVTPDYTPFEAGLGFRVALNQKGNFLGREALERELDAGTQRRRCILAVDGNVPLYGGEPVLVDGNIIGSVTSANYGFSVGSTIAMAYLPTDHADGTDFQIQAFTDYYEATRHDAPLYDPENEKLRS